MVSRFNSKMAQVSRSSRTSQFDVIIVGAGLSGLLAAKAIKDSGQSVQVLEALDQIGGTSRAHSSKGGPIEFGLKVLPATDEAKSALTWLEQTLQFPEPLTVTEIDAAPLTYDDGRFKPYVGFNEKAGDRKIETGAEVEAYALPRRLRLSSLPSQWVQHLGKLLAEIISVKSYVTQINFQGPRQIEVTVNGTKKLLCQHLVFAAPPQLLVGLLPTGTLPARVKQKLAKGDFWTSVNLDLVHQQQITDSESVHVLKGLNEEPTIGLFLPTQADGKQVSQWFTLIPRDQVDEEELVAGALKQIKRQVKRAYESTAQSILQERILVIPGSHGTLNGSIHPINRIPKIDNLILAHAMAASERNLLGALYAARQATTELVNSKSVEKPEELPSFDSTAIV